jgi:acyl-CoA thioester hydrolase
MNSTASPRTLPPYRTGLHPEWIDYNGHLRDAYYGVIMSYAIDDLMDHLGLDAAYRERTRCTLYTLEIHMHYLQEIEQSDQLEVTTSILDADHKRIHAGCRFTCDRLEGAVATGDTMLLHVHQGDKPASTAFPAAVEDILQSLKLSPGLGAAWGPISRQIAIQRRA